MKHLFIVTLGLGLVAVPRAVWADGGYYAGALGARAAGRAGAFAARADDITAVHFNPAGLAKLESTILQVGNRFSNNSYSYTREPTLDWGHASNGVAPLVAFDQVNNSAAGQLLEPLIGVASTLGLRNWGFALAVFAPPGIGREEFPVGGGQNYMMVRREAIILNYAASAAWKFGDLFGIGATFECITVPRLVYSLVIDGSPFAGAANPVSSDLDILATTTGSDPFIFNAILGAWFRPAPWLELALSGQVVPTDVATHSRLSAVPLDPSFGTLVLTRNGVPADDVTVRLPMPMLARFGVRHRHLVGNRERFDVELDLEYETWSRVKRFSVETGGLEANLQGQVVKINRIDIEKHWRDTLAVKLGGDFVVVPDRWTMRGGVYFETAVSDASYAQVDFPGGQQIGASLGTSLFFRRWEVAMAYQLRFQPSVHVSEASALVYQQVPGSSCLPPYTDPGTCNPHYLGQPSPAVNAGTSRAQSHFLSLAFLYRFGAQ